MNVNDAGDLNWNIGYQIADSNMTGYSLLKRSNGRYLISGVTDATQFGLTHIVLIETDSLFDQSLCNMYQPSLTQDTSVLIAAPFNTFSIDTTHAITANYTVSSGVQEAVICTGAVNIIESHPSSDINIYQDIHGNMVADFKYIKGDAVIEIFNTTGQLLKTIFSAISIGPNIILSSENIRDKIAGGPYIFKINIGKNSFAKKVVISN
jgi:hypothetical protein